MDKTLLAIAGSVVIAWTLAATSDSQAHWSSDPYVLEKQLAQSGKNLFQLSANTMQLLKKQATESCYYDAGGCKCPCGSYCYCY